MFKFSLRHLLLGSLSLPAITLPIFNRPQSGPPGLRQGFKKQGKGYGRGRYSRHRMTHDELMAAHARNKKEGIDQKYMHSYRRAWAQFHNKREGKPANAPRWVP